MRYLTLHYCKGTTVSIIQNIFSARIPTKGHITYPQQVSMTMFFAVHGVPRNVVLTGGLQNRKRLVSIQRWIPICIIRALVIGVRIGWGP